MRHHCGGTPRRCPARHRRTTLWVQVRLAHSLLPGSQHELFPHRPRPPPGSRRPGIRDRQPRCQAANNSETGATLRRPRALTCSVVDLQQQLVLDGGRETGDAGKRDQVETFPGPLPRRSKDATRRAVAPPPPDPAAVARGFVQVPVRPPLKPRFRPAARFKAVGRMAEEDGAAACCSKISRNRLSNAWTKAVVFPSKFGVSSVNSPRSFLCLCNSRNREAKAAALSGNTAKYELSNSSPSSASFRRRRVSGRFASGIA